MTFGDCPKYFSFAPSGCYLDDEGFRMHWTKQAAIDRCNNALLQLREMSSEGWILDVEEICWGEIRQSAQEIHHKETPGGEFDYTCDYVLRGIKRPKEVGS
jgi:hypothetical protein